MNPWSPLQQAGAQSTLLRLFLTFPTPYLFIAPNQFMSYLPLPSYWFSTIKIFGDCVPLKSNDIGVASSGVPHSFYLYKARAHAPIRRLFSRKNQSKRKKWGKAQTDTQWVA